MLEHLDQGDSPRQDDARIRVRATKRSWMCPGAGFALVGRREWAVATYAATHAAVAAVLALTQWPCRTTLWSFLALAAIAATLGTSEMLGVKRLELKPSGPRFLTSGFAACAVLYASVGIAAGVMIVVSFGSLRMTGGGMSPTIHHGNRLVYHRRVEPDRLHPDSLILFRNGSDSAWGEPGWLVVSRILAGPGDTLSIAEGRYVVNGVSDSGAGSTGEYNPVIDVPAAPATMTVPQNCYFVVQDTPARGFDSRVLSWIRRENIASTRMWRLSARGFLAAVD